MTKNSEKFCITKYAVTTITMITTMKAQTMN